MLRLQSRYHFFNFIYTTPYTAFLSFLLLPLALGFTVSFIHVEAGALLMVISSFVGILHAYQWMKDLDMEGAYIGVYTKKTLAILGVGFLLFIGSETFLFGTFYSTFVHVATNSNIYTQIPHIGHYFICSTYYVSQVPALWFIDQKKFFIVELSRIAVATFVSIIKIIYNSVLFTPIMGSTAVLVFSSVTLIMFFEDLKRRELNSDMIFFMFSTLYLGLYFVDLQYKEYVHIYFTINDSSFNAAFYTLTGFHGLHVIIGLVLLNVQFERFNTNLLVGSGPTIGLHSSELYWHFVDLIWIVLICTVYILHFS